MLLILKNLQFYRQNEDVTISHPASMDMCTKSDQQTDENVGVLLEINMCDTEVRLYAPQICYFVYSVMHSFV